jgi:hypothetical protein
LYLVARLRMRFNMFGMHVYTENEPNPLAESYLSFDFAGSGHRAALEDTTVTSWGYLPQRTSTYKMGAAQFYDSETFGADATRLASDNWDIADRTTTMMRAAFKFASELGIRTGIGFEPYRNPMEIVRALPPESLSHPGGFIESSTAHDLLERRIPTRPSLLKPGESVRIFINAPGHKAVVSVKLHTRRQGTQGWRISDATHAGRNVYKAKLGPFLASDDAIEYYASATDESKGLSDPPQAPINVYTLNVLA